MRFLVAHGAPINASDKDSKTLLHQAAEWGSLDLILALVAHGASINAGDKEFVTPLHLAAPQVHPDIICALVRHGATIDARLQRQAFHDIASSGL